MLARSDLLNDLTETFTYDALDRLSSSQVSDATTTQTAVNYYYNAMGNLTTKGDVGTYTYPALPNTDPRPHAVTGISFNGGGSATYAYDNNGNMTGGDGRTMTWYSFDKPKSINKSGNTRDFYYGPDRGRYKQVHNSTPKHYIEDSLVTVNDPGGTVETWEMTVFANGQAVAVVKDEDNSGTITKTTNYLHRDHLGSITAVTDLSGSTLNIESLSYDAFGGRRDASDWVGAAVGTPSLDRGYTGHEHLDDVDVIHMNGRIYDPELGRMLSPDPVVQAPTVGQNYNRYSYVLNNPLKYTDPSGYIFDGCFGICAFIAYTFINSVFAATTHQIIHAGGTRRKPNTGGGNGGSGGGSGGGSSSGPDPAELLPNFTIGTGGSSPVQGIAPGQATDVTSVTPGSLTTQPDFPDPPVVNNGESSGAIQTLAGGVSDAGRGVVTINDSPAASIDFGDVLGAVFGARDVLAQTTGVDIKKAGDLGFTVDEDGVPTFNQKHPNYHEYFNQTSCSKSTQGCTFENVVNGVQRFPAPGASGQPVQDESHSSVPGLGTVRHEVYNEGQTIMNVTIEGEHRLHPAKVVRWVTQDANNVYINTAGDGIGALPSVNETLKGIVWDNVDENVYDYIQLK